MASFAMSSREIERGICGSVVGAGSMGASQGSAFSARASRRCTNWRPIFSHNCNIVRAGFLGHGTCIVLSNGREADMGHYNDLNGLEEFLAEFRAMLPAKSETAQAIDRHAPFEQIAFKAIDDGYIDFADQFSRFVETCLRRNL